MGTVASKSKDQRKSGLGNSGRSSGADKSEVERTIDAAAPEPQRVRPVQNWQAALGSIIAAVADLPRYKDLPISEITQHFIAPLRAGRISLAELSQKGSEDAGASLAGFVIWASASEAVGKKIGEQISAGVFPVRLAPQDWQSGDEIWPLDVVGSDRRVATAVLAGVIRSFGGNCVQMHPLVRKLVAPAQTDRAQSGQGHGLPIGKEVPE